MRSQASICLVCLSISLSGQIGVKAQLEKIYGTWQNNQFGYQMTLMLNADGNGEFDGQPIKFSMQESKLSITIGAVVTPYTFVLQANSLTLSGGDLEGSVVFTRNGENTSYGSNIKVEQDPVTPSYSNTASNLMGLWSGNGEMIEFKADGNCVYLGNTFPYQTSQGRLILSTAQGNVTFAYTVKGSHLTLTGAAGQQVIYNKALGASTDNTRGGQGKVAMELVGEWCYLNMNTHLQTSRCIKLFADGTYRYHAEGSRSVNTGTLSGGTASQGDDQGTWNVQDDRLYYVSQTQGQGSFRLEKRNHPMNVNDPMIVIDGEAFVTTSARPPWR